MEVTLNEYYFIDNRLVGRIAENNIALKKGIFTSVNVSKKLENVVYDESGIKYKLGTAGVTPVFESVKDSIRAITYAPVSTVSTIQTVFNKLSSIIGDKSSFSVDLICTKPYKTRVVTKWAVKCLGRTLTLEQTYFPNRATYELALCE